MDNYKERDTLRIVNNIKCGYSSVVQIYFRGKTMFTKDYNIRLLKKVGSDKDLFFSQIKNELSQIDIKTQNDLISKYYKSDSIILSIRENKLKNYENNPCEYIRLEKDKFSSNRTYFTEDLDNISLQKEITGKYSTYYFSIFFYDSYLTIPPKTAKLILLFSDGTKLTKVDDDISVNYADSKSGYRYHSFVTMNANDLKIISTKKITDYKIDIFERSLDAKIANRLRSQIKCMITKK